MVTLSRIAELTIKVATGTESCQAGKHAGQKDAHLFLSIRMTLCVFGSEAERTSAAREPDHKELIGQDPNKARQDLSNAPEYEAPMTTTFLTARVPFLVTAIVGKEG